jgi:hypothetical protein
MKVRKKIDLTMTTMDVLIVMAEGNPGAMSVLAKLMKEPNGVFLILDLDDMGMRGEQIWIAYKDGCGQDIEAIKDFCRSRDEKIVAIVNRESSFDCPRAATGGKS